MPKMLASLRTTADSRILIVGPAGAARNKLQAALERGAGVVQVSDNMGNANWKPKTISVLYWYKDVLVCQLGNVEPGDIMRLDMMISGTGQDNPTTTRPSE